MVAQVLLEALVIIASIAPLEYGIRLCANACLAVVPLVGCNVMRVIKQSARRKQERGSMLLAVDVL